MGDNRYTMSQSSNNNMLVKAIDSGLGDTLTSIFRSNIVMRVAQLCTFEKMLHA